MPQLCPNWFCLDCSQQDYQIALIAYVYCPTVRVRFSNFQYRVPHTQQKREGFNDLLVAERSVLLVDPLASSETASPKPSISSSAAGTVNLSDIRSRTRCSFMLKPFIARFLLSCGYSIVWNWSPGSSWSDQSCKPKWLDQVEINFPATLFFRRDLKPRHDGWIISRRRPRKENLRGIRMELTPVAIPPSQA